MTVDEKLLDASELLNKGRTLSLEPVIVEELCEPINVPMWKEYLKLS